MQDEIFPGPKLGAPRPARAVVCGEYDSTWGKSGFNLKENMYLDNIYKLITISSELLPQNLL